MIGTQIHANSLIDLKEYLGNKFNSDLEKQISLFSIEWQKANPQGLEDIRKVYVESDTYSYEIANYNTWPHRKALYTLVKHILRLAGIKDGLHIVGDGVCSDGIAFATEGFGVSVSDIPTKYYEFGKWRIKKYGVNVPAYDVNDIWDKKFNAIIFVTVLEHIFNLFEFMEKIILMTNVVIEKSAFDAHEQMEYGDKWPDHSKIARYKFYTWMQDRGFNKKKYKLNAYSPNFWERESK